MNYYMFIQDLLPVHILVHLNCISVPQLMLVAFQYVAEIMGKMSTYVNFETILKDQPLVLLVLAISSGFQVVQFV